MEAVNEAHVPCYDKLQDVSATAKGKRTKRQRLPLPLTSAATTTTTNNNQNDRLSTSSSSAAAAATSSEESTTTEEEDTARCLILLARGGRFQTHPLITECADEDDDDDDDDDYHYKQDNSRKRPRAAGGGACMYACKTCGRVFPSFQALGGHRASHKKPKTEKLRTVTFLSDEERLPPTALALQLNNICTTTAEAAAVAPKTFPSPRIHECSYCGAEFASGQALGGHMRRHRPMSLSSKIAAVVEEPGSQSGPGSGPESEPDELIRNRRIGLSLDLNLPAPEKLVLSTPSTTLVDI